MFLKQIRKKTINHEWVIFGKKKGMLKEFYFDITKNGATQKEGIYLYLEHFNFEIENKMTVTFIYLDTTKKANPREKFEFILENPYYLVKSFDNNKRIPIYSKIEEKELWKIRIEIEKCDEVKFYAFW